jgi:DNA-binding CsgD family transcriptional regulator
MALTSRDETDLLLPLYGGMHENPRYHTFLERLRRRLMALSVMLVLRHGDAPLHAAAEFHAGVDLRRKAHELGLAAEIEFDRQRYTSMRLGRVYGLAEFVDHDPAFKAHRDRHFAPLGIVDERVVRILAEDGISAWLVMARDRPCTAADSALLSSLVPYLAVVLRGLVTMEREATAAAMNAASLAQAATGWILFDREARVVAIDPATATALADRAGHVPTPGERLRGLSPVAVRTLVTAAQRFAFGDDAAAGALVLRDEPRLEAVLEPTAAPASATLPAAVMHALVRLPRPPSDRRADRFARLHDLPPREAQLAVALADGQSLAEAGMAMGLTIETTRNYSKRLYARLGVRGQAELVRMVLESAAALA